MTLLWMDGFDHYGSHTNLTGYGVYATASGTLSTSVKRTGTTSKGMSNLDGIKRVFPSAQSAVGVGLALYVTTLPAGGQYSTPFKLNGSSGYGQCFVVVDTNGYLVLWAGNSTLNANTGTQIASTASPVITTASWTHLELSYVPNGASSSLELRVNGVTVINETFAIGSISYGETSATTVSSWSAGQGSDSYIYIDDLYAWNDSGSFNNDFLGDKKVHTMMPNGDTATADWLKNSGTVGYDRINEIGPNGDTSYIYTSTVSAVSAFDIEAMPTDTGVINALQTYRGAKKTDAGTCTVRTDISSGAYTSSGTAQPVTTAYQYYTDVFETDPATGALWTKSAVDSAQVEVERTA